MTGAISEPDLVDAGQVLGYKTNVVLDMRRLGWLIPELKSQPRARIAIADPA